MQAAFLAAQTLFSWTKFGIRIESGSQQENDSATHQISSLSR
jgi:hypothetical protein